MRGSYLWKGILPHAALVAGWGRLEFYHVKWQKGLRETNWKLQSDSLRDMHFTSGR